MVKNKGSRIIVNLECCCDQKISPNKQKRKGFFRYSTTKNRRNTPHRLEINKFCPICNCHSLFKEIK